jgi:hypothetical protein
MRQLGKPESMLPRTLKLNANVGGTMNATTGNRRPRITPPKRARATRAQCLRQVGGSSDLSNFLLWSSIIGYCKVQ